jgi:hypothetical protein
MKGSLFCLSIFWAIGICSAELLAQDRSLNLPAASKTQPENQTTAQIQQTAEAIQTKSLNDEGKTVAPEIGHEQDSMMIIPKSSAPKATNTVTQLENSNPPLGPGQTNSQIIATTQQGLALPETLSCNREMMISYGFKGNLQPLEQPHKYCPSIQQNCCHIDDEEMAMNYWNKNIRHKIERYYDVYLISLKYVLGFSPEVYLLARDFEKSSMLQCQRAATDFLSMELTNELTIRLFNTYVTTLMRLGDLRRGFYCTLCDARTQSKLKDFWASKNLFHQSRIYYSKSFCQRLVDDTIEASFFTTTYLKRYSENMVTLMNCKSGSNTRLTYDLSYETRRQIKECYYFNKRYFFYFCENYCEKFNLTRAAELFDGDILNLKKFVDHIRKYRKSVFKYTTNNILMDGMTFEENYLEDITPEVLRDVVFFRAGGSTQQVMLDRFKTDVIYIGGMDPYLAIENSKFELEISSALTLKSLASVILALAMLLLS